MSRADWLRTFVTVYRAGSVTAGARARGISQPAASQQIAALSRAAGAPLLTRTRDGVAPTSRGRELYAQVAESLDRLETVLADLDGGRLSASDLPVRIGSSADLFEGYVLRRIARWPAPVTAILDGDTRLFAQLTSGEIDLALTLTPPGRRSSFETHVVGRRRFLLVTAAHTAPPEPLVDPAQAAEWLSGSPWVSYSHELPVTRRFWSTHLGRPFDADVRLVAPDLRTVTSAVELGIGASLLPDHACRHQLEAGSVVELFDVTDAALSEPIYCSLRSVDAARNGLRPLVDLIRDPSQPQPASAQD